LRREMLKLYVWKIFRVLEPMAEIYKEIRPLIEGDRCSIAMNGMMGKLTDEFYLVSTEGLR
jgi:hypothetical protein